jgi:hypothetical protein
VNINFKILIPLLFFVPLGCESNKKADEPPFELPKNAKILLSGDSAKTWKLAARFNNKTRMNMGDCFLSHKETYQSDMSVHDNSGDHRDCGETLFANWLFVKDKKENSYLKWTSAQIQTLLNIEEDYKFFKILELSEEQLTIQITHKQFSSKSTTITDFYVSENVTVEGGVFHW